MGSMLFVSLAAWSFWEPDYIKVRLSYLDRIFDIASVLFLLLLLVFFLTERHEETRNYLVLLVVMAGVMTASTVFHSGSGEQLKKCLKYIYPITGAVLLTEMAVRRNAEKAVRAFYAVFWVQAVVNAFSVFVYENGLYVGPDGEAQFFLGQKNLFIMTILPGLCLGYAALVMSGKRMTWDYLVFLALSAASILRIWSASSIVGIFLFAAGILLSKFVRKNFLFSVKTSAAVWAAGFIAIVVLKMQSLLEPVVVHVLHKNMTFSGRIGLWERLMGEITKSPFIGYGVETARQFRAHAEANTNLHLIHSHNYILELLMKGGVILLAVFVLLLLEVSKKLDPLLDTKEARGIAVTLFAFFICFIGDCYEMRTTFYIILTFAVCAGYLPGKGGAAA